MKVPLNGAFVGDGSVRVAELISYFGKEVVSGAKKSIESSH
jgi:hypothetical protein